MSKFQAFQSVRVIDKTLDRFGQVGTSVGMDGEAEKVKFEGEHGGPQVVETFAPAELEGL